MVWASSRAIFSTESFDHPDCIVPRRNDNIDSVDIDGKRLAVEGPLNDGPHRVQS
jgi:hypothetical protein